MLMFSIHATPKSIEERRATHFSAKTCIKHVLRYNLHFFHAFPVKKEGLFERNASVLFKSVMVVMLALYRSFVLEADLAAVEEITEVQT